MLMQLPDMNKRKKYCPMQHQSVINKNKKNTEKLFSYPILCPLCHIHQRKKIKSKFSQFRIYFKVAGQVHIINKKKASTKHGHLIAQVKNTSVIWPIKPRIVRTKKISKASRQEIVDWIMKNSNVRQSTITNDTLLITDVDSKVKRRVPKLLMECSMRQFHNDLIASPDDGSLLGARHDNTNNVIISDTMLRPLAPPQILPMTDHHKMMCGCAICNTSKYMQEYLNAWRRKQLKIMKDKAEHSRGRENYELTQAYKSYAGYAFPRE